MEVPSSSSTPLQMIPSMIISGATGAVGREVVHFCVESNQVGRIVALSRHAINSSDWSKVWPGLDLQKAQGKLEVHPVNWEQLVESTMTKCFDPSLAQMFQGHTFAVNCMGTTRKDAGSAEAFRRVDYDYALAFAKTVQEFSAPTRSLELYSQVSSRNADHTSWFLYLKTKGEADQAVCNMGFPAISIWRPGFLARKEKARGIEKCCGFCAKLMPVETLGEAILKDALNYLQGKNKGQHVQFYDNSSIYNILKDKV